MPHRTPSFLQRAAGGFVGPSCLLWLVACGEDEPIECDPGEAEDFLEFELVAGLYTTGEEVEGPCLRIGDEGIPIVATIAPGSCSPDGSDAQRWSRSNLDSLAFGCESHQWPLGLDTFTYDPKFEILDPTGTAFSHARMLRRVEVTSDRLRLSYSTSSEPDRQALRSKEVRAHFEVVTETPTGPVTLRTWIDSPDRGDEVVLDVFSPLEQGNFPTASTERLRKTP